MVQRLEQEFGPEALRNEIKKMGSAGVTEAFFGDFCKRWMERTRNGIQRPYLMTR